jgi:hypothetical protein
MQKLENPHEVSQGVMQTERVLCEKNRCVGMGRGVAKAKIAFGKPH